MTLADAQAAFWRAARRESERSEILATFRSTPGFDAAARMNVYAGAYIARQQKTLLTLFEKTAARLGRRFHELCRDYVRTTPCSAPAIEYVGAQFPDYLASVAETAHVDAITLDVARLEWTRLDSLLTPEPSAPLRLEDLAHLSVEGLLTTTSSVRMLRCSKAAWDVFRGADDTAPATFSNGGTVGEGTIQVVFSRSGFAVRSRPVAVDEAKALELLREGAPLATICECFAAADNPAGRAHRVLSRWLRDQVVELAPLDC